jgi:hypothetical protein
MNSRNGPALSSPTWGAARLPYGGLALVALWTLLWALFLGTLGRGRPPAPGDAVAAAADAARPGR